MAKRKPKTQPKQETITPEKGEIQIPVNANTKDFFNHITTKKYERIEYCGEGGIKMAENYIKANEEQIERVIVYKDGFGVFFDTRLEQFVNVYNSIRSSTTIEITRIKVEK